jgi:hypothetical protein
MKYHEAINGHDGKLWKAEVPKEHQRMIDNGVFEPVTLSDVPKGVRLMIQHGLCKRNVVGLLEGGSMSGGSSILTDSTMMGHALVH